MQELWRVVSLLGRSIILIGDRLQVGSGERECRVDVHFGMSSECLPAEGHYLEVSGVVEMSQRLSEVLGGCVGDVRRDASF